jgi:hypothetical protein
MEKELRKYPSRKMLKHAFDQAWHRMDSVCSDCPSQMHNNNEVKMMVVTTPSPWKLIAILGIKTKIELLKRGNNR